MFPFKLRRKVRSGLYTKNHKSRNTPHYPDHADDRPDLRTRQSGDSTTYPDHAACQQLCRLEEKGEGVSLTLGLGPVSSLADIWRQSQPPTDAGARGLCGPVNVDEVRIACCPPGMVHPKARVLFFTRPVPAVVFVAL
jgi:hypothetical protein